MSTTNYVDKRIYIKNTSTMKGLNVNSPRHLCRGNPLWLPLSIEVQPGESRNF